MFVGDEVSLLDEFRRAEEGTDVFGLERGRLFERGHGVVSACVCFRGYQGCDVVDDDGPMSRNASKVILSSVSKLVEVGVPRTSGHHVTFCHF